VQPTDFGGAPVNIVDAVNHWAASHTNNKIKDLLHPDDIDGLTRLILTNAIYFKGDWERKFVAVNTVDEEFHLSNGKTVKTPLMHQKEFVGYMEDDTVQAVELPYQDGDLSMIVVLPKAGISSVERVLTDEQLTVIRKSLQRAEVRIALPKFTFTRRTYLDKTLFQLGMPDAFAEGVADFSGMTGGKDLYIKHVIHEAFIAVNEEGSEAAGATAVVMNTRAVHIDMTKEFTADHPFLFSIVQKSSGAILFMGKVEDPRP
jgi:serpin B